MAYYTHRIDISGNFRDESAMEWAGRGECLPSTGEIECAANLADGAYDAIGEQLQAGRTSGEVTAQGEDREITYTWSVEPTGVLTNDQRTLAEHIAEHADEQGTIQADGMVALSMDGSIRNDPTLHTTTRLADAWRIAGLPDDTAEQLWG